MINIPLKKGIKAVLLSPSPDQRVNILEANTLLEHHTVQIKSISEKYGIGFVDSNRMFKQMVVSGEPIVKYMSQINHPNVRGHQLISNRIISYFK